MENQNEKQNLQNGGAQPTEGTTAPKANPQNEGAAVKEGDPSQQRPQHGADAGTNTSSREDQLPSLNDGAALGADADSDVDELDDLEKQQEGSDADHDQNGRSSV